MTINYAIKSITKRIGKTPLLVQLLLSTCFGVVFAQNYPVTCTPIVKPSYSLKWSEISTSTDMFKVHLLLKDLTKPSVDVYLKIRLSGVGIDIRTVDGFIPNQTLTLIPGQPRMLTTSDLAEYFNISNLVVDGVDISALYNGGRLPEGLYTWTVEAYEVDRNRQVSNTGMALMNVFKNYPPIINIPQDGAILPVTTPQNVLFSWTSRSTASLNAAQGKTYKLRIYPLSGDDDPNVVANSGIQPIEITTTNPYFNYGAGNIPLEKGKRYAVQVQESDANGADEYENEGKSQVVTFSYGKPCVAPEGLVVNPIGKGRVQVTCEATAEDAETYPMTAWYKQAGTTVWNALPMNNNSAVISGLKDKTFYEFKLSSACGDNTNTMTALRAGDMLPSGDASTDPVTFKIDDSEFDEEVEELDPAILDPYTIGVTLNADGTTRPVETLEGIFNKIIKPKCVTDADAYAECSPNHQFVDLPPVDAEDLRSLNVGDVLGIYDYAVLVTATNGSSPFSGKGLVRLPFLDNAFMAVEFSGIKAKKGEAGTQGGCVYYAGDVSISGSPLGAGGYFRTRPISQADLQNEQVRTIADIIKLTEPTVFHGDLEVAIKKYQEKGDEIVSKGMATPQEKQDLLTYTKGVETAVGTWKDKFSEVFGSGETDPKVAEILGDMTAILTQLNADKQTIEGGTPPAGTSYPTIPDLKAKIDAIIEKIKALQQENSPKPPKIQNVLATNIGYNEATLTWQGDPRFTKYVISYKTADGGELLETVYSNRLDLKKLRENSEYGFKIEGYVGEDVVDTFENGEFTTLTHKLPPPINLLSTKLTGKSTKLSWDKDPKHKSYKLTYRSRDGELHTIFPQTNEVIIDNLDPTEVYPYEVIALSDNLVSNAANSEFTTGLICSVSLKVSNLNISKGEQTTLTASCGSTISWYNGGEDMGVIQGNIISWQNGETATISSDKKMLVVTPTQNTSYTVVCEVTDGIEIKSCTSTSLISVQPEICKYFTLNASKNIVESGSPIILTANGCVGNFSWDNQQGYEKIITVRPVDNSSFSATCKTDENTCVAKVDVGIIEEENCACSISQTINYNLSCGFWGLGQCDHYVFSLKCFAAYPSALKTSWDYSGNSKDIQDYTKNIEQSYSIKVFEVVEPKSSGIVTATYSFMDGMICKKSTIINTKEKNCDFSITQKIESDGGITLTQVGCSAGNTVIWDDGTGGIKGVLTQQPSITVPPIDKKYTAICGRSSCVAETYVKNPVSLGLLVTAQDLLGNPKTYNNGKVLDIPVTEYPVKIDGLYCNGNLTWSSSPKVELNINNNSISITTPPIQTTTYIATCIKDNIVMHQSVTINILSKSCFALEAPATIEMGEDAALTVTENSGCVGDITWFQGDALIDEGTEIFVTPLQNTTYTAKCSNPQCAESVTIKVKPCSLDIASSTGKNSVKMGETATLTVEGCSVGTINWQGGDADGESGNEIIVRPFEKTTYVATCDIIDGCSKTIIIDVITDLPPKIPCENFTLTANKTEANIGENITLTANGCTGGTISWPNNSTIVSVNTAKVTISTCGENNYAATCQKGGQVGTSQVKINGNLNFTVEPITASIPINSSKSVIITANGCESGSINWTTAEATKSITVTQVGNYAATCTLEGCPTTTKNSTVSSSCPDLKILASKNAIETTTDITMTVVGCSGGTVTWNDGLVATSMVRTLSITPPTSPQIFTVTCSLCTVNNKASTTITKLIRPTPTDCARAGFATLASRDVYYENEEYPISLGITNSYNCPGTISWNVPDPNNVRPTVSNNTYYATCTYEGQQCDASKVTITVRPCSDFRVEPIQSYTTTTTVKGLGCYGSISWNNIVKLGGLNGGSFQFEVPTSAGIGKVTCDLPKCERQITISTKKDCPTLTWGESPTCFQERGWDGRYYTSDQHTFTLDNNACPYYAITLANETGEFANERTSKTLRIVRSATAPRKLILRCFSDATHSKEVCKTETPYLPLGPLGTNSCPITTTASADPNSETEPNSRILNSATIDGTETYLCNAPIPMSTAATGYLAKLCEDIGQLKDENGKSFLKNADGTMSEANAKQMFALVEQALKNSDNSDLSNFTTPTDQAAILAALQTGNCTAFGTEMAKGYSNTITAGGYNTTILSTFEETERTALKVLYQLPEAIKAILARIRQGNIDKKESISISDIIHNYEIAFGMVKKKDGVMEYYQPLVLSDGITTVSAIQLLFSDNIVKVNPVPLPPAVDISLKDRHEKETTIGYGYESRASANWITITNNNKEEFQALKQYLNPPSYTATFPITGEQLREIYCDDVNKCKKPSLDKCIEVANLINKYSDKFGINSSLRMSHFLGQIGWESGRLTAMGAKSGEGTCFKESSKGWRIWFGLTWKEIPFDKEGCPDAPSNANKPRKKKNDWSDISEVPKKYICDGGEVDAKTAGKNLYCYVYRCEGGNGDENSCDGFRYRGHGIMQLTWKKQYVAFDNWLQKNGFSHDYNKVLSEPDEGFKNIELEILSGMWFWDKTDCNETADNIESGSTQDEFDKITKKINTGLDASEKRKEIFEKAYSKLKK